VVANLTMSFADPEEQTDERLDSHLLPESVSGFSARERLFNVVQVVRERDILTFEHSRRVAIYARRLARALGHTGDDAQQYALLGLVHDAGKIMIGEAILNKCGALTPAEIDEIRQHATIGALLIAGYDLPEFFTPAVRHHHEAYNGSGYPKHLCGDAIPEAARLIAIVDAFDVITSARPYKVAETSLTVALDTIAADAGRQFDPEMARVFVDVARQRPHFIVPARLCAVKTGTARDQIATDF
jgi:HD-GYP domain-containing protein (c-di-GMP phosphodiesterase class II)